MARIYAVVLEQLDGQLDELHREREQVMRQPGGVERSVHMAELYEVEAAVLSSIYEHCRTRVYWRAALGAREYALAAARAWRRRALADEPLDLGEAPQGVAA